MGNTSADKAKATPSGRKPLDDGSQGVPGKGPVTEAGAADAATAGTEATGADGADPGDPVDAPADGKKKNGKKKAAADAVAEAPVRTKPKRGVEVDWDPTEFLNLDEFAAEILDDPRRVVSYAILHRDDFKSRRIRVNGANYDHVCENAETGAWQYVPAGK